MIVDLYAQITPDNYDQILKHITNMQQWTTSEQAYALFQIGRYVNIFILDDSRTYWAIYEVCSHSQICDSFDELLTQLFIAQLEN